MSAKFCVDTEYDSDIVDKILLAIDDCGIAWRAGQKPTGYGYKGDEGVSRFLAVNDGELYATGNSLNHERVSVGNFINRCVGGKYA